MNCTEASQLLEAYHDGELDLVRSVEIEQHLAACERCALALKNLRALSAAISPASFPAPADLRRQLFSRSQKPARNFNRNLTDVLALAAALVLGFFLAQVFSRARSENALLATLTDDHIRSLAGSHLTDVASTDQHTVRPWFEGKIDFAPPVEDLSAVGFPLIGGRLEFISGRAVAALVYQRRKHFINLFIWPGDKSEPIAAKKSQRGYNILHWENGGMNYWAVSEISADDLRKFADAVSSATNSAKK